MFEILVSNIVSYEFDKENIYLKCENGVSIVKLDNDLYL